MKMLKIIKKIILLNILSFFLVNSYLKSEIVEKIEIFGNERVSKEAIKVFSNVSIGQNLEKRDINIILKSLISLKI